MRRSKEQISRDRERLLAEIPDSWTTVSDLAAEGQRSHVYGDLRWLEKQELATSREARSDKLLFFCLEDRWVLTGDNYEGCKGGGHRIRPFHPKVREWRLTAAGRRLVAERYPVAA